MIRSGKCCFIFDMDGLLVNTEPLWQQAEIFCFEQIGISLSSDMCRETMGLRVDEAVDYWLVKYKSQEEPGALAERVLQKLIDLVRSNASLLPGVQKTLNFLKDQNVIIALASSSPYRVINTVLDTTGISGYFSVVHSAQDERKGKPDPSVFISTMVKAGVKRDDCIVLEDSVNGMRAALTAGAYTIVIPDADWYDDPSFDEAHMKLRSMEEFNPGIFF